MPPPGARPEPAKPRLRHRRAHAGQALRQPIEADTAADAALSVPRGAMPDLLARLDARLAGMGAAVAE
ncbi:MAG: hypothetical protein AAFU55_03460, partial [Pseudomonadota bacterium]